MKIDLNRNRQIFSIIKSNLLNPSIRHLFALSVNRNQVEWLIDKLYEAYDELNRLYALPKGTEHDLSSTNTNP